MSEPGNRLPPAAVADPVGLALGALGFGIMLGVGCQGLVTLLVRTVQGGMPASARVDLTSAPALVLLIGTFAGMVVAGIATGALLTPVRNPWRQAMLAAVAALASLVVSLVTIPVDKLLGRAGLASLVVLAGLGCLLIGRRLSRARIPA